MEMCSWIGNLESIKTGILCDRYPPEWPPVSPASCHSHSWVILSHVGPGLVHVTPSTQQRDGISLLRLRGEEWFLSMGVLFSFALSASLRSLALGEASCHVESSSGEKCTRWSTEALSQQPARNGDLSNNHMSESGSRLPSPSQAF